MIRLLFMFGTLLGCVTAVGAQGASSTTRPTSAAGRGTGARSRPDTRSTRRRRRNLRACAERGVSADGLGGRHAQPLSVDCMIDNRSFSPIGNFSLCLILILSLAYLGFAQNQSTGQINESLRSELLKMQEEDQKYRKQTLEIEKSILSPDEKEKRLAALMEKQSEADKRNIKRLAEIIEMYGWPGNSLVGKDGSLTAFLIIQHADLEYQKKYFHLLKEAIGKGEANPSYAAYLEDRILMREGKKQIYGTQLDRNEVTKKLELWPVEDEEHVDARRARLGLEPIAEYLKRFGLEYKPPIKK